MPALATLYCSEKVIASVMERMEEQHECIGTKNGDNTEQVSANIKNKTRGNNYKRKVR